MDRIAALDISRRLSGIVPGWVISIASALLGVGLAVLLRACTDIFAPGVAPYAFIYPAVLVATLIGGWQAGVATMALSAGLAWMFVVPEAARQGAAMHYQAAAMIVTVITASTVVAAAQGFRMAGRRMAEERNAKLAQRELLFRELQHRVANDFAIVSSLLDLQRRLGQAPETRAALEQAVARVRSIGRIHRKLFTLPDALTVDMPLYLGDLCNGLSEATLPPVGITLACRCEPAVMAHDKALAVALIVNELVTNAVKHAFPAGREGHIAVDFARATDGWQLKIADDGVRLPPAPRKSGLGSGLIEQFVRQLDGTLEITENPATFVIRLPASAADTPG